MTLAKLFFFWSKAKLFLRWFHTKRSPRMQRLDRTRPEPVKDNGLGLNPLDAAYPLEFAF